MNRLRVWISILVALLIIGGACAWMVLSPSNASPQQPISTDTQPSSANNMTGNPEAGTHPKSTAQEQHMRQQHIEALIEQQLKAFQLKSGNITLFLNELQQQCPLDDCKALLKKVLANYPDQQFAKLLERTLERMPAYEKAMQSTVMSTSIPPQQRYDKIWQLREQMLGQQEAELAFGQERAFAQYQLEYGNLMQRAKDMPMEQRIQELNRLQQQAIKAFPELLPEIEGNAGSYEKELQLSLLGVNDAQQRQHITQQLRQKHFSSEQTAQMNARDYQVEQQQVVVMQYQTELAQLKQQMNQQKSVLSDHQWQQQYELRLNQLRLKHFP
jgi:hypothetical protein